MDLATGYLRRETLGQLAYRAPESIASAGGDERSDVYGFCAIAYLMLAGEPPYSGRSVAEVVSAVRRGGCQALQERRDDLGEELAALVDTGLAIDPGERPESLVELHDVAQGALLHYRWLAEQRGFGALDTANTDTQHIPPGRRPAEPASTPSLPEARAVEPAPADASRPDPVDSESDEDDLGLTRIRELKRRASDHIAKKRFGLAAKALRKILAYEHEGPQYAEEVERARQLLSRVETRRAERPGG
jgi:serine/threonine protein kinase